MISLCFAFYVLLNWILRATDRKQYSSYYSFMIKSKSVKQQVFRYFLVHHFCFHQITSEAYSENPVKHLRWRFLKKSEQTSAASYFHKKLYFRSLKRDWMHCHYTHTHKNSIKGFFSKCDEIHRKLRIRSHLLKKS